MLREDALAVIRSQAAQQGVISWARVEQLAWSGSTPPPITARMALVRIVRATGSDLVLCASMEPGAPAVSSGARRPQPWASPETHSVQCQSLARFLKELGASNQVDKQLIALFASSGTNSSLTSRKLFLPALRIIARRGAWRPSLRYTHMPEGMAELERAAALNASLFRDGMLAAAAKLPEVHAGLADCSTQVADAARFFEQHARSTGRHSKPRAGTASAKWTDALLLLEHTRKVLAAVPEQLLGLDGGFTERLQAGRKVAEHDARDGRTGRSSDTIDTAEPDADATIGSFSQPVRLLKHVRMVPARNHRVSGRRITSTLAAAAISSVLGPGDQLLGPRRAWTTDLLEATRVTEVSSASRTVSQSLPKMLDPATAEFGSVFRLRQVGGGIPTDAFVKVDPQIAREFVGSIPEASPGMPTGYGRADVVAFLAEFKRLAQEKGSVSFRDVIRLMPVGQVFALLGLPGLQSSGRTLPLLASSARALVKELEAVFPGYNRPRPIRSGFVHAGPPLGLVADRCDQRIGRTAALRQTGGAGTGGSGAAAGELADSDADSNDDEGSEADEVDDDDEDVVDDEQEDGVQDEQEDEFDDDDEDEGPEEDDGGHEEDFGDDDDDAGSQASFRPGSDGSSDDDDDDDEEEVDGDRAHATPSRTGAGGGCKASPASTGGSNLTDVLCQFAEPAVSLLARTGLVKLGGCSSEPRAMEGLARKPICKVRAVPDVCSAIGLAQQDLQALFGDAWKRGSSRAGDGAAGGAGAAPVEVPAELQLDWSGSCHPPVLSEDLLQALGAAPAPAADDKRPHRDDDDVSCSQDNPDAVDCLFGRFADILCVASGTFEWQMPYLRGSLNALLVEGRQAASTQPKSSPDVRELQDRQRDKSFFEAAVHQIASREPLSGAVRLKDGVTLLGLSSFVPGTDVEVAAAMTCGPVAPSRSDLAHLRRGRGLSPRVALARSIPRGDRVTGGLVCRFGLTAREFVRGLALPIILGPLRLVSSSSDFRGLFAVHIGAATAEAGRFMQWRAANTRKFLSSATAALPRAWERALRVTHRRLTAGRVPADDSAETRKRFDAGVRELDSRLQEALERTEGRVVLRQLVPEVAWDPVLQSVTLRTRAGFEEETKANPFWLFLEIRAQALIGRACNPLADCSSDAARAGGARRASKRSRAKLCSLVMASQQSVEWFGWRLERHGGTALRFLFAGVPQSELQSAARALATGDSRFVFRLSKGFNNICRAVLGPSSVSGAPAIATAMRMAAADLAAIYARFALREEGIEVVGQEAWPFEPKPDVAEFEAALPACLHPSQLPNQPLECAIEGCGSQEGRATLAVPRTCGARQIAMLKAQGPGAADLAIQGLQELGVGWAGAKEAATAAAAAASAAGIEGLVVHGYGGAARGGRPRPSTGHTFDPTVHRSVRLWPSRAATALHMALVLLSDKHPASRARYAALVHWFGTGKAPGASEAERATAIHASDLPTSSFKGAQLEPRLASMLSKVMSRGVFVARQPPSQASFEAATGRAIKALAAKRAQAAPGTAIALPVLPGLIPYASVPPGSKHGALGFTTPPGEAYAADDGRASASGWWCPFSRRLAELLSKRVASAIVAHFGPSHVQPWRQARMDGPGRKRWNADAPHESWGLLHESQGREPLPLAHVLAPPSADSSTFPGAVAGGLKCPEPRVFVPEAMVEELGKCLSYRSRIMPQTLEKLQTPRRTSLELLSDAVVHPSVLTPAYALVPVSQPTRSFTASLTSRGT
ncbi:hypothetical protein FNF29_03010 [Cafeteria roenbergensis]|uniref:Uncharacterized protein n=1 Tax=Cafeteria roenbergensis TaxID=33653 RepID=A0A5A8CKK4_CAFRO|nr:hypothetical protein FNF29_03010 [Cafeteria roenbergensis]|eukprot:KAA0153622.1 hypothetical protein FNF29_03010 [Cafeteria roenbergensis]